MYSVDLNNYHIKEIFPKSNIFNSVDIKYICKDINNRELSTDVYLLKYTK